MDLAEYAAQHDLAKVGGRLPLPQYLAEVWKRRAFIYRMSRYRIESDNQQTSLGMVWVVLKPLLNALVYGMIFGVVLGSAGRPPHFVPFLVIGVFFFEFFSASWTHGGRAITNNAALVQSLSFPRMVLPIAEVVERFLMFLPTLGIMVVFLLLSHVRPTTHWLLVFPLLVIYFFICCGLALITARLAVHWPDLNNFLPFLTRLLFYTTGIFFSVEKRFGPKPPSAAHPHGVPGHEKILFVSNWQPIHEIMSLARSLLLEGPSYAVDERYWYRAVGWAVLLMVVGVVFFWRAEERYGRVS